MLENNRYNLIVQTADRLALEIYKATRDFPEEEIMGLISQIRKAALSVPSNVVEGSLRSGRRDQIRFYNIAAASLGKLEYFIEFAKKLEYISSSTANNLIKQKVEVDRLVKELICTIKTPGFNRINNEKISDRVSKPIENRRCVTNEPRYRKKFSFVRFILSLL